MHNSFLHHAVHINFERRSPAVKLKMRRRGFERRVSATQIRCGFAKKANFIVRRFSALNKRPYLIG